MIISRHNVSTKSVGTRFLSSYFVSFVWNFKHIFFFVRDQMTGRHFATTFKRYLFCEKTHFLPSIDSIIQSCFLKINRLNVNRMYSGQAQTKIGRSDRSARLEQSPFTVKFQQQRRRKLIDEKVAKQRKYQQRQHADKFKLQ